MAKSGIGMARVPRAGPAADLLERVIENLIRTGDANFSLRQLAADVGTSHRMLKYHFNTRVELMVTVLFALNERDPLYIPESTTRAEFLRKTWEISRTPAHQLYLLLFFTVSDTAAQATKEELEPLSELAAQWTTPYVALGVAEGLTQAQAVSEVIAVIACQRGLHNDLLVGTHDEVAIDAAFEALLAMVTRRTDIQ